MMMRLMAAAEEEKKSSAEPANRNERAGTLVRAADDFWVHSKPSEAPHYCCGVRGEEVLDMDGRDRQKKRVQGHIPSSTVVIPPCDPIWIHMGPPPHFFFCHLICISKCDGSSKQITLAIIMWWWMMVVWAPQKFNNLFRMLIRFFSS